MTAVLVNHALVTLDSKNSRHREELRVRGDWMTKQHDWAVEVSGKLQLAPPPEIETEFVTEIE